MCRRSWLTLLFEIQNTGSFGVTPQRSPFKEGFGFGLGVSGEEIYVRSMVDLEGIWVEYHLEGLNVGYSRGLLESEFVTSCEGGWFWPLVFFLVLPLLAINKLRNQC